MGMVYSTQIFSTGAALRYVEWVIEYGGKALYVLYYILYSFSYILSIVISIDEDF